MSITLKYLNTPEEENSYYKLHASIGNGAKREIVIDTGSTGIVVPLSAITDYDDITQNYPVPGYSSSGNTYKGKWVKTTVELTGADGITVTTNEIIVFGATEIVTGGDVNDVSMMGVGFQSTDYPIDQFNPFINVSGLSGGFSQGYIISSSEVILGLNDTLMEGFSLVNLAQNLIQSKNWQLPSASVTVSFDEAKLSPFLIPAPFLVDTGIPEMILTAGDWYPGYYEERKEKPYHFVAGVKVDLSIQTKSGIINCVFTTTDATDTNIPGQIDPAYVRWGLSTKGTIINTGRHFTYAYHYMFDPVNGRIGFKSVS